MRTACVISTAIWIALGSSVLLGQTVKVNWSTKAPFQDYKTYTWHFAKNQGNDFYRQWARADVDAQLAKKGLTKVTLDEKPDLLIAYTFTTQELMDSTTTSDGFGWGDEPWGYWGGWGGWADDGPTFSDTESRPRLLGILSVDIVDASTRKLVWRGQGTQDSVANNQKGDEKEVLKSVEKMFRQFPPKKD